jgi:hypothetical protein
VTHTGREALLAGDAETAMAVFADEVARKPTDPEARYWLAAAQWQAGEYAGDSLNDARTLHALALVRGMGLDIMRLRDEPPFAAEVARMLYGHHLVATASVAWGMALAGGEVDAPALVSYGLSLQHQGRIDEASDIFRVAADSFPSAAIHQFLLFPQVFREDGDRMHAKEARAWAHRWGLAPPPERFANPPLAGRKLRIGYVAPTFAASQLRQFLAPVLENHDSSAVEVTLYPADASTETAWPDWIRVHAIGGLSDSDAAELIRRDGIDVLSDCWGPTAGSRHGVFARKPAPVQFAWINMINTTGLSQMDYVLHADHPGSLDMTELFTEEIWPIGPVFTAFRPAGGRLPPAPTPAKVEGVVTLASFNHPAKLTDGVLAAWATVLRNAANTRLLLKYRYFADPVLQRTTQARFAAHGVAPERLQFEGHSSGDEYFQAFGRVDLMLDGWPAPGATTTLEALSNGVPVLAMVGNGKGLGGFYARTILEACGLGDLATPTPEAFVAKALALVADLDQLEALRARVRPGFDGSAIRDEAGFTRRLERACADMFARWEDHGASPDVMTATPLSLGR